jgi:type III secretion protein D
MKALRVLTGLHAGAQISVANGSYRISNEEDADICISDWQTEPIVLQLDDDDGVARLCSANGDKVLIADFMAVPYGDVVFCVGPQDAVWPRDIELLAGLWQTAPLVAADQAQQIATSTPANAEASAEAPAAQSFAADDTQPDAGIAPAVPGDVSMPRSKRWRAAAVALTCTGIVAAVAVTGVMLTGAQSSEAANLKVNDDALSKELTAALRGAGMKDLHVDRRTGGFTVSGIVTSNEDNTKARHIFDALAHGRVRRDYDVAELDIDDIQQSLADTGAQVSYSGAGVFRVSGSVHAMSAFRDRIASVRADLDRNIKRIDVDVKETQTPTPDVEYTEVVVSGGLRYIETPDGIKHLLASSPDNDNGNE